MNLSAVLSAVLQVTRIGSSSRSCETVTYAVLVPDNADSM